MHLAYIQCIFEIVKQCNGLIKVKIMCNVYSVISSFKII